MIPGKESFLLIIFFFTSIKLTCYIAVSKNDELFEKVMRTLKIYYVNTKKQTLKFLSIIVLVCSSFALYGFSENKWQEKDTLKQYIPEVGNRSILINIRPVFRYLGNMFNGSTNNDLSLSNASMILRTYQKNNFVNRYFCNMSFIRTEETFDNPEPFNDGKNVPFGFSLRLGIGKQKHINFDKLSFYYGHEIGGSFLYTQRTYKYDFNDGDEVQDGFYPSSTRVLMDSKRMNFEANIAGIIGVDYFFSKRFFLNADLKVPLTFSYDILFPNEEASVRVSSPPSKLSTVKIESGESDHLFNILFFSNTIINFNIGFVF